MTSYPNNPPSNSLPNVPQHAQNHSKSVAKIDPPPSLSPRSGSILIFALITVAVCSLLLIGFSFFLRPSLAISSSLNNFRASTDLCYSTITNFTTSVLDADTNGVDLLSEPWHSLYSLPYASITSEFPPLSSDPLVNKGALLPLHSPPGSDDEESRLPLNLPITGPFANLISILTETPRTLCIQIDNEAKSARPFSCREQLLSLPSITPEIYSAIAPYVTAAPTEGINLNTASEPVLNALFSFVRQYDTTAALTLSTKILAHRAAGGTFPSPSLSDINQTLHGLSQAELALLSACSKHLFTESRFFSGAAVAPPCQILFTYDRKEKRLIRTTLSSPLPHTL